MPAITVDDVTTLDRVRDAATDRQRPVRSITSAPQGFEGEGFPVRRAFAGVDLSALDPFIHMDQMGEVEYAPGEPKGTPWHPHRGFETVTYIIDGTFEHQDSHGGGGLITNGDTQWMTAGDGTVGAEGRPVRTGQLVVFGPGDVVSVAAAAAQEDRHPAFEVLLLGGRPIREPVAWGGPFVMNTKVEVLEAFEDFQAGR